VLSFALAPARGQAPPGSDRLCEGGSDAVLKKGPWTTVEKPEGLPKITAHAVGGDAGKLILVTDGRVVMRSTDRGCSWATVYSVASPGAEETPVDGLVPEVARLLVPTASSRALMILQGVGGVAGSRVLHSAEGGEQGTWKEAAGLPQALRFRELVAPRDTPEVLYLLTGLQDATGELDPGAGGPLYVSRDGGATFAAGAAGGQIEKLDVEPDTGGQNSWLVRSNGTVQTSRDFGASFETQTIEPAGEPPDPAQGELPEVGVIFRDIAVFKFATTNHAVVALASPSPPADVTRAVLSLDKGRSWQDIPVDGLGPAGGLFFGNADSQLYSSVPSDNTAYRGPGLVRFDEEEGRWVAMDDFGLGTLKDARAVREPAAAQPQYNAFWLRRDRPDPDVPDLLARFEPPAPELRPPVPKGRADCGSTQAKELPGKKVSFEPARIELSLKPGEPQSVPLKADITGDPTPSDVFFLLDHSDSTSDTLDALFCSVTRLVRDLPERNLDIHFGLGAYNGIDEHTYRRLVNVLEPKLAGPAISAALKTLFSTNGVDEPLRSALFQTATGAGLEKGSRARAVDPGQQADWRPAQLKIPRVALVITDEPYEENTRGEPAIQTVIDALKAKDIKVIGLRIEPAAKEQATSADRSPVRQALLQRQLVNIARGTGALAPEGGVDCDGGGTPDIPTGEPIVCTIDEGGVKRQLDDTLVSIFQSLAGEDRKPVKLVPTETSGLAAEVQGGESEVDLRRPSRVEGTVVLSCTTEQTGKRYPLTFSAVSGERVLGTLEGMVQCGEIPAAVPPVVPPRAKPGKPAAKPEPAPEAAPAPAAAPQAPNVVPAPQVPVPQPAVAVAPPPPPPAPAPVSSAPAQAPAPASAQAAAPQAGMSAQEDRQVASKLATVTTDSGTSDEGAKGSLAMVRARPVATRRPSPVPTEAIVTLGLGVAGLFGYVAYAADPRRRRRREAAPAYARRDDD